MYSRKMVWVYNIAVAVSWHIPFRRKQRVDEKLELKDRSLTSHTEDPLPGTAILNQFIDHLKNPEYM